MDRSASLQERDCSEFRGLVRSKSTTFWSILATVLAVYGVFPSEASSDQFVLALRIASLGGLVLVAMTLGEIRERSIPLLALLSFIFVASVALANAPHFSPRVLNLAATVVLTALIIGFSVGERFNLVFAQVLEALLIIAVAGLYLQLGIYLMTGVIEELHAVIFPWSSSRSGELEKFGFARLSGIHIEPGTHAAYTVGLLILRKCFGKSLFDRLGFFSIVSAACTLSFWAILATVVYGFSYVIGRAEGKGGMGKLFLSSALVVTLFVSSIFFLPTEFLDNVSEYFRARSELADGSGGSKVIAWQFGLRELEGLAFFGLPVGVDYCNGCISPQDAGLVLNFFLYFGVASGAIFFCIYVFSLYRVGRFSLLFFGGLFLFSKFFYFDSIVWLIFFAVQIYAFEKPRPY